MGLFLIVINDQERTCLQQQDGIGYDHLLEEVFGKWPQLIGMNIQFKYTIGRHSNCIMKSVNDFQNMCMLGRAMSVSCIDVLVEHVKGNSMSANNNNSTVKECETSKRKLPEGNCRKQGDKKRQQVDDRQHPGGLVDECLTIYSQFDLRSIDKDLGTCSNMGEEAEYEGTNAVPLYDVCPDIKEQPQLTNGWERCITGEGQVFKHGRAEFKEELTKYATKLGFNFTFKKNNKDYVYAQCKEKGASGCQWVVRGKEDEVSGLFVVHKARLEHDCLGQLDVKDHGRIGPSMWGDLVQEQVRNVPAHKGNVMRDYIKTNYGVDIPYFTAYRAVQKAKGNMYGTFEASYDQLEWWGEALVKKNPGSVADMEFTETTETVQGRKGQAPKTVTKRTFKRSFYAFDACIHGFQFCRPMLFVDGCHMIGRWTGTILTATSKDGNNGLFPVAFAIVPVENFENWVWFLTKLRDLVKHEKKIWYVSDRNTGLMSAFPKVFNEPVHFYCLFHLHNNLRGYYSGPFTNKHRADMCHLLSECAYAPDVRLFEQSMIKFRALGGKLADQFLADLPYEKWAFAYSNHIQRFGEMTSNAAESFNSWIKLARALPITYLVDTIRSDIMRWYVERRREAASWLSKLCVKRQDIWNSNVAYSRTWFVFECPNGNYKVESKVSVEVDVIARTCSCAQWQIHGFPCAHATAAIRKGGYRIEEVIEPCFFTETYKRCYERNINPIPDTEKFACPAFKKDIKILPPKNKNKPGRPKTKRIKSYGEVRKVPKTVCIVCGELSRHDPITCNMTK